MSLQRLQLHWIRCAPKIQIWVVGDQRSSPFLGMCFGSGLEWLSSWILVQTFDSADWKEWETTKAVNKMHIDIGPIVFHRLSRLFGSQVQDGY